MLFCDSKIAIDCINDNQQPVPWNIYALMTKIREEISDFESISFVAIRRFDNLQARNLAKESPRSSSEFMCSL